MSRGIYMLLRILLMSKASGGRLLVFVIKGHEFKSDCGRLIILGIDASPAMLVNGSTYIIEITEPQYHTQMPVDLALIALIVCTNVHRFFNDGCLELDTREQPIVGFNIFFAEMQVYKMKFSKMFEECCSSEDAYTNNIAKCRFLFEDVTTKCTDGASCTGEYPAVPSFPRFDWTSSNLMNTTDAHQRYGRVSILIPMKPNTSQLFISL